MLDKLPVEYQDLLTQEFGRAIDAGYQKQDAANFALSKLRPRPNALDSSDVERESEALWNVNQGASQ